MPDASLSCLMLGDRDNLAQCNELECLDGCRLDVASKLKSRLSLPGLQADNLAQCNELECLDGCRLDVASKLKSRLSLPGLQVAGLNLRAHRTFAPLVLPRALQHVGLAMLATPVVPNHQSRRLQRFPGGIYTDTDKGSFVVEQGTCPALNRKSAQAASPAQTLPSKTLLEQVNLPGPQQKERAGCKSCANLALENIAAVPLDSQLQCCGEKIG
eukprot:CAMPEP_0172782268 /NCGR_PEP_ID=MMETSP1074-20121228/203846_1 /TAXON_ID=2916 /ORGANISM="Ceratium fusus, Strain PA161109" /LENGTH=213 /DNA_ID=CAMNT_0013619251 /DNA_START=395 /DNA_END=1038 /DNA_ORIENTATION=-